MSEVCKCCGQTLPPAIDTGLVLAPGYQRILDALHRAGKHGIESERLFAILYSHDPHGGPVTGLKCMHVRIWYLNQQLKKVGLRVKGQHTGSAENGYYRLVNVV